MAKGYLIIVNPFSVPIQIIKNADKDGLTDNEELTSTFREVAAIIVVIR
ncbi:hypothetical protein BSG1_00800 [Bacillus sp. SG-1]|nr:hypothetical protein BSG1_00800 [Bacillus sp. SG-1]